MTFLQPWGLQCQPCALLLTIPCLYCHIPSLLSEVHQIKLQANQEEFRQSKPDKPLVLRPWQTSFKAYGVFLAVAVWCCGVTKRLVSSCILLGVVGEASRGRKAEGVSCFAFFSVAARGEWSFIRAP